MKQALSARPWRPKLIYPEQKQFRVIFPFKAQTAPGFVCHQILRGVELSKENAIYILRMGVKAA
jgi:hypothetical protein